MPRIKVTGYIDTEMLEPEEVDLGHEMGLSNAGYELYTDKLFGLLDDVDFKLVKS